MLLHSHYMQPFSRVNGLEKLANTDGYQMIVSYDDILKQILPPSDNLVMLDDVLSGVATAPKTAPQEVPRYRTAL